ncbi:molybdenum cofactor guanylyltransferase MobA [Aliarcobacter butzleri]|uniref:molybdenum cofactor guanylyltransferase MobA n=1 Tax=Aliarcobacter butzleri TaxID=28197 RepID=UPI00126108FC|nr:molybdenum cofactor guanylyltransferase MobA [Aliarcobacter butzleri]
MNIIPFKIPCVILSGGKSSRMGEDKSLLPFGSSNSLIEYQYKRLKPYFKNLYISSKIDKFNFLNPNDLILDENQEIYSPILALYSIFKKLPNQNIFIITVDSPFVSINSIKTLIDNSNTSDITIAKTEKTHNLCGVFSSNLIFKIEQMINEDIHKIFFLIRNSSSNIITFYDDKEFININKKEEYEESLSFIKKYYDSYN